MKYEVIFEKGNYALILRGKRMEEYAVVYGLNKERGDWEYTCEYYNFGDYAPLTKVEALLNAVDLLLVKIQADYISLGRMSEIATKAIDGLLEDDEEMAMEYFENELELEDYEMEYFGIRKDDEK